MAFSYRLKQFFCYSTVKTGSAIIGILGCSSAIIDLFGTTNVTVYVGPDSTWTEKDENIFEIMQGVVVFYSFSHRVVRTVLNLTVYLLLLWGIYQKDRRFLLPYLVLQFITCIWALVISLNVFTLIFFSPQDVIEFVISLFLLFALTGLYWYFWLCVWSHYMELKDEEEQ